MKDQHSHLTLSALLSRRDFLRYAGYGALALSQLDLLAAQAQGRSHVTLHPMAVPGDSTLQLPFWNDAGWSQPEYYETIQAGRRSLPRAIQAPEVNFGRADVNDDNQDELFARGPKGLLVNVYDPVTGQWLPMTVPQDANDSPIWSDAEGWNLPQYYQTIQTADVNGDQIEELLARSASGIQLWGYNSFQNTPTYGQWIALLDGPNWSDNAGWNLPQYYETIQCANIDGNGPYLIGRAPDNDPYGSGIQVWRYQGSTSDPTHQGWTNASGPLWTDAAGWNLPQYYQTIQCADVDGNAAGTLNELLGQGPDGMEMWAFDWDSSSPNYNTWVKGVNVWGASGNFTQPASYRTIQLADIDGDYAQELIVRGPNGILAWKFSGFAYVPAGQTWIPLPAGPAWSDANGWNQPQYYETIQCADIDGDGFMELIGRAPDNDPNGSGIQVWKFVPGQGYPGNPVGQWTQMPSGPAWTDAAGWNRVERYSTIQSATVHLPGPETPSPPFALLGRGPLGMQTWYYNLTTKTWQQTSAGYPAFTPSQQAAYVQLDTSLRGLAANSNIRSIYSDQTARFSTWMGAMYTTPPLQYNTPPSLRPHTNLALPTTNPPSQADWDAVTWQIYWEMAYVVSVNDWYFNKTNVLITNTFLKQDFTLQSVGDYMQYASDSETQILLSVLALLFGIVAGVVGFPELDAAVIAAVSSTLGAAFSGAASLLPNGGNPVQTAYNQLQEQLTTAFSQTKNANSANQFAITGGTNPGGSYVPADWGLLSNLGPWIGNGTWSWPSDTSGLQTTMQQRYAVTAWQALLSASPWYVARNPDLGPPGAFPPQYQYNTGSGLGDQHYLCTDQNDYFSVVPTPTLSALFDTSIVGQPFPLQVPLTDVYNGQNGWPTLGTACFSDGCWESAPVPTASGVDLRTVVRLSRDPSTKEIVAAITLLNRGLTAATNLEITAAQLRSKKPLSALPTRPTRLATGKTGTYSVRFPNLTADQRVVLRISGAYLGGTFGASFRVTLP